MPGLTMRCAACSDAGRRDNNEDAVYCSPRLAAVADGVGGAAAGEVASRWAINQMAGLDKRRLATTLDAALRGAVAEANATVRFLAECRPEWSGMATTLSAVALANDPEYLIASVGDSRVYLLRAGRLHRLTRDHSLVQALVDQGAITPAQARAHPQRSVVLEALDGRDDLSWEPDRQPARAGDRLLLCSDGVSDYLEHDEIAGLLGMASRESAAGALVSAALEAGSRDNASAVVADVVTCVDPGAGWLNAL
jgi:PPM family protein phosphatase